MARPEQEVAEELRRLNCPVNHKQLRVLANNLGDNERIVDAFSEPNRELIAATLLQVVAAVICQVGSFFPHEEYDLRHLFWSDVENCDLVQGDTTWEGYYRLFVRGYGKFDTITTSFEASRIDGHQLEAFMDRLRERVAASKAGYSPVAFAASTASSSPQEGLVAQLERLATLREKGHITPEEFEAAKRKLLA